MAKGKTVHKTKSPPYRTVRCRATKGLTKWCYGLCKPVDGWGFCGRPAPHAQKGRTQKAIAKHLAAKKEAAEKAKGGC